MALPYIHATDKAKRRAVKEDEKNIKGYYTISSGSVSFEIVPENLPQHPVPLVLLGRLAVDRTAQGTGLGSLLLVHALKRALEISKHLGVHAVAVDAINESARAFYLKYGFTSLLDDELHLYLPMKTIQKLKLYE